DELKAMLRTKADEVASAFGVTVEMRTQVSGESFYTPPGEFSHMVARAVLAETGVEPVLSTSGGTSDARFIRKHCPVVEFGLVGKSMHKVDEHVDVEQIHQLKAIYARVLSQYFS
ncbi:MAG TPA: M20/M25/M40 family metallo-hydrolase, partial [Paracoccaceae bacterium]|nr:M20/M25/M40 family metallo-hydrolase [Paracoccaceae bacterium]